MKKVLVFLALVVLFYPSMVFAGFKCAQDPSLPAPGPNTPTPLPRCVEDASAVMSLNECLQKQHVVGVDASGNIISDYCKGDPRYSLRNFAPFLLFPSVGSVMGLLINLITFGAGLIAGGTMLYGAYQYLSSGGDPKKVETGRNNIVYALIGLVVILISYAIVRVILTATGTNTIGF